MAVAAVATMVASLSSSVSPLVVAVALGAVAANVGLVGPRLQPGLSTAAGLLLRIGVVLLGLRLSVGDVAALGSSGILVVAGTVAVTFFGTQAIGRRLGLSPDLSLLVATGYSICGASAIGAVSGATEADEEEVAAAIGLVTLFGSLAILTLPILAGPLALDGDRFGPWAGASVHDVAQVVATASAGGSATVAAAMVVKLTRVALLTPIVVGVSMQRRRAGGAQPDRRPPLLPWFVIGFLAAVAIRSTGVVSTAAIDGARAVEGWLFAIALVGLGAGVRIDRLRRLGPRPLALGAAAWVLVAATAGIGLHLVA